LFLSSATAATGISLPAYFPPEVFAIQRYRYRTAPGHSLIKYE
jgi:hypothetical protein